MKIGYYPGCTLKAKAKNLEDSAVAAMKALGVEMVELDRWNCCGAVHNLADDDHGWGVNIGGLCFGDERFQRRHNCPLRRQCCVFDYSGGRSAGLSSRLETFGYLPKLPHAHIEHERVDFGQGLVIDF